MGDLMSYIAHMGIVRVLSVPVGMGIALWLIWRAAAPAPWKEDDDADTHRA
ncbi:MAG: hypothetical protein WAU33_21200 [Candidatus Binataceae bacterium]|jgi:hypothetical protein